MQADFQAESRYAADVWCLFIASEGKTNSNVRLMIDGETEYGSYRDHMYSHEWRRLVAAVSIAQDEVKSKPHGKRDFHRTGKTVLPPFMDDQLQMSTRLQHTLSEFPFRRYTRPDISLRLPRCLRLHRWPAHGLAAPP